MTSTQPDSSAAATPRFALLWAMLACAAAALTLAYPALSGGFLVNPHSDQYIAGFAFREYAAEMLRTQGQFPMWNPYLFGGMPYVDAMHGDIFYPTFLLRMVLPTDVAMTWGMIAHVWLAGVAGYALFRAHGLSFAAALTGGIAYMMSGMIAGLVSPGHDGKLFISALFPLTMLVLRYGLRDGRRWAWGVLAIIVGLGVLSPHPQLLQYLLLASGFYALWIGFGEPGAGAPSRADAARRLGFALGAVALGFVIGAIQYLPVMEYTPFSPRADGHDWATATSYSMPPEEIVSTVLPQFSGILDNYWGRNGIHFHSEYLGLPLLFLAAAAFGITDARHRRWGWFWLGVLIISGLWALGGYTPFFHVVYNLVPGTKYFRAPSTIMFVTAFAAAALAAIGAHRLFSEGFTKRYLAACGIALGVLALLGVTGAISDIFGNIPRTDPERIEANRSAVTLGAWRMFFFGAVALGALYGVSAKRISLRVGAWAVALVIVADLWSVERHYWLFSPRAAQVYGSDAAIERIRSDSVPGRVFAFQVRGAPAAWRDPFLTGDALMSHEVRQVTGYHGDELARYRELHMQGLAGSIDPALAELTNLRWLYTNVGDLPAPFEKVLGPVTNAAGSEVWLYRMPGDNRAAWIVPAIMKAPDDRVFATLMTTEAVRSVAFFDTLSEVTGEQLTAAPAPLGIRARVTQYDPGAITVELDAPAPAKSALVVSENFYPGWTATVDGQPAVADRANYTLIGVPLVAGARKIELRFVNEPYARGKRLTLIAIVLAMLLAAAGAVFDRRVARA